MLSNFLKTKNIFLDFFKIHVTLVFLLAFIFRLYIVSVSDHVFLSQPILDFFRFIIFDFVTAIYTFTPIFVGLIFVTILQRLPKAQKTLLVSLLFFDIYLLLFSVVGEYFFFDEFKDRFNFIAVDYLVYSNEVLNNILESYPVFTILFGILVVTIALTVIFYRTLKSQTGLHVTLRHVFISGVVYMMFYILSLAMVNESNLIGKASVSETILTKNGIHSLFAAYRNNQIDFYRFYTSMDKPLAHQLTYNQYLKFDQSNPGQIEIASQKENSNEKENSQSYFRHYKSVASAHKYNVVVLLMESLSARYMGLYGSDKNITPELDKLARNGLFFNRMYATGTRTVRGIEATVLSIPPTPGQSIVRRPFSTGLDSIGTILKKQNYDNKFIYGGNAYFDNMGDFFSGNGFSVVDKKSFAPDEIHFANAWGVADEDLYAKVIQEANKSYNNGQLFFNFVLTTSNHRPYTFPEGKIDLPSGKSGRDGAVKYSDYAIGQFIEKAKKEKWFDSTIFVFVSDHNASVAGGENILKEDYLIPLIFYAPKIIKPEVNNFLSSQIDFVPTLLGLLNMSYDSKFFGVDLNKVNPQRAFLGTYQKVSCMNEKEMIILSPVTKISKFNLVDQNDAKKNFMSEEVLPKIEDSTADDIKNCVALYQTASDVFTEHELQETHKIPATENVRLILNHK